MVGVNTRQNKIMRPEGSTHRPLSTDHCPLPTAYCPLLSGVAFALALSLRSFNFLAATKSLIST